MDNDLLRYTENLQYEELSGSEIAEVLRDEGYLPNEVEDVLTHLGYTISIESTDTEIILLVSDDAQEGSYKSEVAFPNDLDLG